MTPTQPKLPTATIPANLQVVGPMTLPPVNRRERVDPQAQEAAERLREKIAEREARHDRQR